MDASHGSSILSRIFRPFEWRFIVKAVILTAAMLLIEHVVMHGLLDVQNSRGSILASPGQSILRGFHRKVNSDSIRIARLDCSTANSIDGVDPCSACGMRQQIAELLPKFIERYQPSVIAIDFFFDSQTYCEGGINQQLNDVVTKVCSAGPATRLVFAYGTTGNVVQRPLFPPAVQSADRNCHEGYSNPSRDPRQVYYRSNLQHGAAPVASFAAQTATLFGKKLAIDNSAEPLRYAYLLSPDELKAITRDMSSLAGANPKDDQHKVWIFGSTHDNLFELPASLTQALFDPHAGRYLYGHELHAIHVAALIDDMTAQPGGPYIDFFAGLLLWTAVELARSPLKGGLVFLAGLGLVYILNSLLFWIGGYYSDFATLSFAGILIWTGSNALPNLLRMHGAQAHQ